MATQGLVSVTRQGVVTCKAICGCNGMPAKSLAKFIRQKQTDDPRTILEAARRLRFGCRDCLVVQSCPTRYLPADMDLEAGATRYAEMFGNPRFNPRWEHGTADYVLVVEIGPAPSRHIPR